MTFDGKHPLKEYLMHFKRCLIVNSWNDEQEALFLTASLKGESRKLLSGMTEADCRQYDKIVEKLEQRYGVEKQAEIHQAMLHNRRQSEGENLQTLATDIRFLVDLAYQDVGSNVQERFAVQHFIDALWERDDRMYLRREKPATLDEALSRARELESLRLLDTNNVVRKNKVRYISNEQSQLQQEVEQLRLKVAQQQLQLEAQQAIIKQLSPSLGAQGRSGGTQNKAREMEERECWKCGKKGHLKRHCDKERKPPAQGNEGRVSPGSQGVP